MSTNSPVISTSASQPSELHDDAAMTEMLGSNEALHALFHQFDEDGNGTLSKTELEHGLNSIGQAPSSEELEEIWEFLDDQGQGRVEEQRFVDGIGHMVLKFVMKRQTVTDANGIGEHPLSHASSGCNTPHDRERGSSVGSDGHLSDGHPPTTRRLSGYDSPTEHATHETNGDTTGTDLAVLNRHLRRRVSELQERTELQGAELRELVEAANTTDETSDEVNQLRWRCKQLELQMAEHDRERRHAEAEAILEQERARAAVADEIKQLRDKHAAELQGLSEELDAARAERDAVTEKARSVALRDISHRINKEATDLSQAQVRRWLRPMTQCSGRVLPHALLLVLGQLQKIKEQLDTHLLQSESHLHETLRQYDEHFHTALRRVETERQRLGVIKDKMEENIMERAQDLEAMYQLHNVGSGFDGSPSFMQESLPQHREELEVEVQRLQEEIATHLQSREEEMDAMLRMAKKSADSDSDEEISIVRSVWLRSQTVALTITPPDVAVERFDFVLLSVTWRRGVSVCFQMRNSFSGVFGLFETQRPGDQKEPPSSLTQGELRKPVDREGSILDVLFSSPPAGPQEEPAPIKPEGSIFDLFFEPDNHGEPDDEVLAMALQINESSEKRRRSLPLGNSTIKPVERRGSLEETDSEASDNPADYKKSPHGSSCKSISDYGDEGSISDDEGSISA